MSKAIELKAAIASLEDVLSHHQLKGLDRIHAKLASLETIDQKTFFYVFGICSRWFEKNPVELSSDYWQQHDTFGVLPSWQWPSLARFYLLMVLADRNSKDEYIQLFSALFNTADVNESEMLIQSLAFVPHAEAFVGKAREAARSNIVPLFNSVAHNTDFPQKHFDEIGWNQLILKAAFLNVSIVGIHGLKRRNNADLVVMLADYAKERQVASRTVPWDLWCCVAWAAKTEEDCEHLQAQFDRGDLKTKGAIALALSESDEALAQTLGNRLLLSAELQSLAQPLTWSILEVIEAC